jgi:hypothetical protein
MLEPDKFTVDRHAEGEGLLMTSSVPMWLSLLTVAGSISMVASFGFSIEKLIIWKEKMDENQP